MPPDQMFASIRAAGLLARLCPWAVLPSAKAPDESLRLQETESRVPFASRAHAIAPLPLPMRVKTPRASQALRDTPPRAAKVESCLVQVIELPAAPATKAVKGAQSAQDTETLRAACRLQAADSLRRPQTRVQPQPAIPKPPKPPAYSPAVSRYPSRNADRCAPDISKRFASTFQCKRWSPAHVPPPAPSP